MWIDNLSNSWRFAMSWVNGAWLLLWSLWLALGEQGQVQILGAVKLDPAVWLPVVGVLGAEVARRIKQPSLHKPASDA